MTDLIGLLAVQIDLSDEEKRLIRRLDRFYIPARYPDALPGSIEEGMPTESDAKEALQTAKAAFKLFQID